MAGKVKPIPEGYEGATPYICCKGAARAIEFYKKAYGATELFRMGTPDGSIGHAEIKIGGTPVTMYIYVENVDAFAKRAIDAGIKVLRPLADQFYGNRSVQFEDPFGHVWAFATHIEDVPLDEINRRAKEKFGGG